MKKCKLVLLFLSFYLLLPAQINTSDSTVQVISYWNLHDRQKYTISEESYKVQNGSDTTEREFFLYDVDVEVIDSTKNGYTIQWKYGNFQIKASSNPIMEKLLSLSNDLPVIFRTNELGVFQEVVNWQDLRDIFKKGIALLKADFKDKVPGFEAALSQIEDTYSAKETIENSCIREIQQFHTFHGGKYKLEEEINTTVKRPNIYGDTPFDAELNVLLDEINAADDNSVIRFTQTINNKQLTDAAYAYVCKLVASMSVAVPKREDFPLAINEIRTASRIHGSSGWPIYSIETQEVSVNNVLSVKERIIELQ